MDIMSEGKYSTIAEPVQQENFWDVISVGKPSVITNLVRPQEINSGKNPISVINVGRPSPIFAPPPFFR